MTINPIRSSAHFVYSSIANLFKKNVDNQVPTENLITITIDTTERIGIINSIFNIFEKIKFYSLNFFFKPKILDLNKVFEIGDDNNKLPAPVSPLLNPLPQEKTINIARLKQFNNPDQAKITEKNIFFKELEQNTLDSLPKPTINIEEIIERQNTIHAQLKKFTTLPSLVPFDNQQDHTMDTITPSLNWSEKSLINLSELLKLDSVELSEIIQNTNNLVEKTLKNANKPQKEVIKLMKKLQQNLNKLQNLFTSKQVLRKNCKKFDELETYYKSYIKSYNISLKNMIANPGNIKKSIDFFKKHSSLLVQKLAKIEFIISELQS